MPNVRDVSALCAAMLLSACLTYAQTESAIMADTVDTDDAIAVADSTSDTGTVTSTPDTPTSEAEEDTPIKKKEKQYHVSFHWNFSPFSFQGDSFSTIYNDGYDDYDIDFEADSIERSYNFGLLFGGRVYNHAIFRTDLEVCFEFTGSEKEQGVAFGIRALPGIELAKIMRVSPLLGYQFGWISSTVGYVGTGNNTGADFMLGPSGEHIDKGTPIYLNTSIGQLEGGGQIGAVLFNKLMLAVYGSYIFWGTGGKWDVQTNTSEDSRVTLPRSSFEDLSKLGTIDLTGPKFGFKIGYTWKR